MSVPDFAAVERYFGESKELPPPFTVVAMFTPSYSGFANRLRVSLEGHRLRYCLFETPEVHRSISAKGGDNHAFTKPSFIAFALRRFGTPILYLDCDMVVRSAPIRIEALCAARREFAIYNWLADEHTDCYVPVNAPGVPPNRVYRFAHSIDQYAPEQLICSGAAQFWTDSAATGTLLAEWARAIEQFPHWSDDKCLDFAFNNGEARMALRFAWLDKAYARYAWWPHIEPVLDHPQFPASADPAPIRSPDGRSRHYAENAEIRRSSKAIARDCLVDVVNGRLFRLRAQVPAGNSFELVSAGMVDGRFFPAEPADDSAGNQ